MDTQQETNTPNDGIPSQRVELHVPWITFLKVLVALMVAYAVYVLWPLLMLVFLATFLAVTLHAFVEWLDAKRMPHWASVLTVISSMLGVLGLCVALIVPSLITQASTFMQNLPKLREQALQQLPEGSVIREGIEHMLDSEHWSEAGTWLGQFMSVGSVALSGISEIALLIVIAMYLLIDGGKTYEWVLAFFSPLKRAKLRLTAEELSNVIFGYISGQVATSVLVTIYTFAVLHLLHVPAALMLSILAGILDILPIIGFFIAAAPAFLLAMSVSPQTALSVLGLYFLFHAIESYYIVPMVYGKNLRVSTLTVLLGLLAGTLLAGISGALAALPVIASYAAIERIWLKPFLRDGVSEKHELQKDQQFGDKL
jgi:predicted PurR-regulated permease PerM